MRRKRIWNIFLQESCRKSTCEGLSTVSIMFQHVWQSPLSKVFGPYLKIWLSRSSLDAYGLESQNEAWDFCQLMRTRNPILGRRPRFGWLLASRISSRVESLYSPPHLLAFSARVDSQPRHFIFTKIISQDTVRSGTNTNNKRAKRQTTNLKTSSKH
jgi:hypothetical protein